MRQYALPIAVATASLALIVSGTVIVVRGLLDHPQAMIFLAFSAGGSLMVFVGVKNAIHPTARVSQRQDRFGMSTGHRQATSLDGLRLVLLGAVFLIGATTGDLIGSVIRDLLGK